MCALGSFAAGLDGPPQALRQQVCRSTREHEVVALRGGEAGAGRRNQGIGQSGLDHSRPGAGGKAGQGMARATPHHHSQGKASPTARPAPHHSQGKGCIATLPAQGLPTCRMEYTLRPCCGMASTHGRLAIERRSSSLEGGHGVRGTRRGWNGWTVIERGHGACAG